MTRLINVLRNAAVLLVTLITGCQATVMPPASPVDPVQVYLIMDGPHSSILLPTPDENYIEYTYGEWDFFALENNGGLRAVSALVHSSPAALGRRVIPIWGRPIVASEVPCDSIHGFMADQQDVDGLRGQLGDLYASASADEIYNPSYSLWFVPHPVPYSMNHTCNHETARWLRELGCDVEVGNLTTGFRIRTPPGLRDASPE